MAVAINAIRRLEAKVEDLTTAINSSKAIQSPQGIPQGGEVRPGPADMAHGSYTGGSTSWSCLVASPRRPCK